MGKDIIVNGIDVSECVQYKNNGKCRIPHYQQGIKYVSCNCNEWDCEYKQLKRLQEENEGLKEKNKSIAKDYVGVFGDYQKYKQALEEIRELYKNKIFCLCDKTEENCPCHNCRILGQLDMVDNIDKIINECLEK